MPKKKKGGKGKKAGKIIDGLSTSEMSRDQLLGHIKRLQAEIEREREERNFFMLEREKLFTLWNMAVETLAMEKEKGKLAEIHMENAEQETQDEVNFAKQKLRFILAEQSNKIGMVRLSQLMKMKGIQNDAWVVQLTMQESLEAKKRELRNAELSMLELLRRMRMEHSDEISTLRQQFTEEVRRIEVVLDRKITKDRVRADLDKKEKMAEQRLTKEKQLEQMLQMHEKQLLDMKTFFNDLTVNNFAVLSSLQSEIATKKSQEQRLKRQLKEAQDKHGSLLIPLREYEQKVTDWADEGVKVEKIRRELFNVEKQLRSNRRYTHMMDCAHEALIQRSTFVRRERDELKTAFSNALIEMQKKSSLHRLVLKMKLQAISKESELAYACNETIAKRTSGEIGVDCTSHFLDTLNDPLEEIRADISDGATEFRNTYSNLKDTLTNASVDQDEIGYLARKVGAAPRAREDKKTASKKLTNRAGSQIRDEFNVRFNQEAQDYQRSKSFHLAKSQYHISARPPSRND